MAGTSSLKEIRRFFIVSFLICLIWIQDIAKRVIAEGLRVEQTITSKIMTRTPVYVMSDTLAIEALQKMVQGIL